MFIVYDIVSRVLYKVYGLCASVAEVLCESAIAKIAVSLWGWSSLQVIVCELMGVGGEGRKGRTDRRKGRAGYKDLP